MPSPEGSTKRQTGQYYENLARRFLQRAGLRFVAANCRFRCGEIDLVMRDGTTWVFVEVRYRRTAAFGGAPGSITPTKQRRIQQAAACWLAQRDESLFTADCRFDVFTITGQQTEWLADAF